MTVITMTRKFPFLVLVLLLAITTTNIVRAKVSSVNDGVISSSFKVAGRTLQINPNPIGGANYQGNVAPSFELDTYTYEDLSDYQPWPIGTPALLEFADGWYEGKIANYSLSSDHKNATYIVTWSDGTSDIFFNELEWIDLMVANANDYEPWEMGTPTFGYPNPDAGQNPDDAFLSGEITGFGEGLYTITWSNGDVLPYSDFDMVDVLVNNAGMNIDPSWMDFYDPWPSGTPVSWDFDDGWWDGTIKGFSDGTYEVEWSDGSTKTYSNLEKIDQMVAFANGDGFIGNLGEHTTPYADFRSEDADPYAEYYDLETVVYAEFQDGWWAGYVDSYQGEYYVIRWSDDSVDLFLPGNDMDEIVANSRYIPKEYGIYPVGTHVLKEFDGIWYWGTIEYSAGGFYTILWDDGERTQYVSGAEIDEMVANAYDTGMSGVGKFALGLFILACFGGIAFFLFKRQKTQQELADLTEQVRENELDLDEGDDSQYSDKPDEEGKDDVV